MKLRDRITVLAACLCVSALAGASTLTGTVRNGTTGQPAAGDEVVLLSVSGGVTEIGRSKTDASGGFHFTTPEMPGTRVVRVVHQGVPYHGMGPAGVNSVQVQVYDVAANLDGITAAWDIQRYQTQGDVLQVIEEIAVRNASDPPRTLMNERPFEIQLPVEAEIVAGKVQIAGGQRITHLPNPGAQKGRYYFPIALRPGETRFAIGYRLPYKGEALIEPNIRYPLERLVVVLPKSIAFEAATPGVFRAVRGDASTNTQQAGAIKPGQSLAFRLSGTGTLAPGDGVHPPVEERGRTPAPTVLPESTRGYGRFLLGAVAVILAGALAGFLAHRRKRVRPVPQSAPVQSNAAVSRRSKQHDRQMV